MAFTEYGIVPGDITPGGIVQSTDEGLVGTPEPFPAGPLQDSYVIGSEIFGLPGTTGTGFDSRWVLSSTGQNLYTVDTTTGAVRLQSETVFGNLNQSRSRFNEQILGGTLDILLADGTIGSYTIKNNTVAGVGQRLAWFTNEDGTRSIKTVDASKTLTQLMATELGITGFLNAHDAAAYVVTGELLKLGRQGKEHDPRADAMVEKGREILGDESASRYDAIKAYINQQSLEGLTVYRSRVFR